MSKRKDNLRKLIKIAEEPSGTYSAIMRDLNKDGDKVKRLAFMRSFKEAFDNAMSQSLEDAQSVALLEAQQEIDA